MKFSQLFFVLLLCFSFTGKGIAESEWEFTEQWAIPYKPFDNEGVVVESADHAGAVLFGIPGIIVGIPVGLVSAPIGQIVSGEPEAAFDQGFKTTAKAFSITGKYVVGLPIYLLKKGLWDGPIYIGKKSTQLYRKFKD